MSQSIAHLTLLEHLTKLNKQILSFHDHEAEPDESRLTT